MGTATGRMTVDDYYAITVEGDRKQLVDGRIIVGEPKLIHEVLKSRLIIALGVWAEDGPDRGLAVGATDVRVDEHNVFGPDVVWIAERHRPADLNRYPDRIPDICVEIRSPSTWRYDVGPKRDAYERGGSPELWLVDDGARSVTVHRRSRPDGPTFDIVRQLAVGDELTSPQLPGFALPLERLFRD